MTEARENLPPDFVGVARIKVHPGPELSQALECFMSPDYVRSLGGKAINLVSEKKLHIYSHPLPEDLLQHQVISKGELAKLSTRLTQRQANLTPRISPHVLMAGSPPPEDSEHEGNGIDMRFKIVIDELTERLLSNTVFVDTQDSGVYTHLTLRRSNMLLGMGLNDARDNLLELLRHKPQYVQSMYIDAPDMKP